MIARFCQDGQISHKHGIASMAVVVFERQMALKNLVRTKYMEIEDGNEKSRLSRV